MEIIVLFCVALFVLGFMWYSLIAYFRKKMR